MTEASTLGNSFGLSSFFSYDKLSPTKNHLVFQFPHIMNHGSIIKLLRFLIGVML
jgi:hypothetical protein